MLYRQEIERLVRNTSDTDSGENIKVCTITGIVFSVACASPAYALYCWFQFSKVKRGLIPRYPRWLLLWSSMVAVEEKDFHTDSEVRCEGAHPICSALSRRGLNSGVVRGSHGVTALYHCFLDKITVIPLLSEGNYSFTSVTEKVKRYLAHKVLPLPHCKF